MALHPRFPSSPYAELLPEQRWFPATEELRSTAQEKLVPPLVAAIRREVKTWRDSGYVDASSTTRALLRWQFDTEHLFEGADGTLSPFRYYYAQREAVETVLWLHVMAGTTVAELQELGAWKSAEMVRRYAHFAPEQLRAAADRLATFSYTPPKNEATEVAQGIE